jgi:hypothetical protein
MSAEVCPNIGPRQRRRRLYLGTAGSIAAVLWAIVLTDRNASLLLRTTVFLPLLVGAFGWFQYFSRTCVRLAVSGRRNLDSGSERVSDMAELIAIRRQARFVVMQALISATVVTAIYLITG